MPAWKRLDAKISLVELPHRLSVAGAMTAEDSP
jgi:hypothetical protein